MPALSVLALATFLFEQTASAEPGSNRGGRRLIAQNERENHEALPPRPRLRRRGAGDEANPEFRPRRIDGAAENSFARNPQAFRNPRLGAANRFGKGATGAAFPAAERAGNGAAAGNNNSNGIAEFSRGGQRDQFAQNKLSQNTPSGDADMPGSRMRRKYGDTSLRGNSNNGGTADGGNRAGLGNGSNPDAVGNNASVRFGNNIAPGANSAATFGGGSRADNGGSFRNGNNSDFAGRFRRNNTNDNGVAPGSNGFANNRPNGGAFRNANAAAAGINPDMALRANRAPAAARQAQGGGVFGKTLDLTPLGLNDDQKNRVRQMRVQTRAKIRDLHKSVVQRQKELRQLMFDPDASDDQIRTARSQLRKLQDQVDETNMNDLLAIRGMLTPEQRKRLPECMPAPVAAAGANLSQNNSQQAPPAPPPPPSDNNQAIFPRKQTNKS
jgi:Spy/CpxP family protein refolding chaperone